MQLSLFPSEPTPGKPVLKITRTTRKNPDPKQEDSRILMRKTLAEFLPEKAVEPVITWLLDHQVQLRISNSRSTKLGDYRAPGAGRLPAISVNHNLNQSSFLVTLVHEMAHHDVMQSVVNKQKFNPFRRKKRLKPHGPEWQSGFRRLMEPYLHTGIFPEDVLAAIRQYLEKPKASTTADRKLYVILKKYDQPDGTLFLEKLPPDAVFQLPDGRKFRKGERVRTRYRCISLNNGKIYLFNPMAQVFLI